MNPRTILVTGATGALGTAVAKRFLEDGHRVAATWIAEDQRARSAEGLAGFGDRVAFARADVTDESSVNEAVELVGERFGPPEALVHLVGGGRGGQKVEEQDLELWRSMLSLNLTSAFIAARAVLPAMRTAGWGRIVLVSSRTARVGRSSQSAYAVAKAGLVTLAETIAEETRGTGITANVVAPSTLNTPANRKAFPAADHSSWVPVEDVAATVSFLCSEEAGQLRGAWLPVYGSVR